MRSHWWSRARLGLQARRAGETQRKAKLRSPHFRCALAAERLEQRLLLSAVVELNAPNTNYSTSWTNSGPVPITGISATLVSVLGGPEGTTVAGGNLGCDRTIGLPTEVAFIRMLVAPDYQRSRESVAPVCALNHSPDWSPVGNPGNAADPLTGHGAVAYSYNIGTYDVTNSQYAAFLNTKDPTVANVLNLWNTNMGTAPYGGTAYNSAAGAVGSIR
jgi:hypothetical protein